MPETSDSGGLRTESAHPETRPARIAVVVPAYRTAATIRKVLAAIPSDVRHVVVVDDASPDSLADALAGVDDTRLVVVRQMPLLRCAGNLALSFLVKAASGYWSLFDQFNAYIALRSSLIWAPRTGQIADRYLFEISLLCEAYLTPAAGTPADVTDAALARSPIRFPRSIDGSLRRTSRPRESRGGSVTLPSPSAGATPVSRFKAAVKSPPPSGIPSRANKGSGRPEGPPLQHGLVTLARY